MASGGLMTYWTILVWSPARGTSPQNMTIPFSGILSNVFRRAATDSMAPVTFFIVVFDLMFDAADSSFLR